MSLEVRITKHAQRNMDSLGLNDLQVGHVLDLIERLGDYDDPLMSSDLDVRKIDHFFEIRYLVDSGGPLLRRTIQVCFGIIETDEELVVLRIAESDSDPSTIEVIELEDLFITYMSARKQVRESE